MQSAIAGNWIPRKTSVQGTSGMVAAQNSQAAAVGAAVLREGGNAVDAAVATSFALAATEPWMSGLGGGGFMLIWLAAERAFHAIDFGMVAPEDLDPADYPIGGTPAGDIVFGWPGVVDDRNLLGPLSIAVPGHVDGVGLALERFGRMDLPQVMAGAIELAERGLGVDWYASLLIAVGARGLARFPASRQIWLRDGLPPIPDWEQPVRPLELGNLARTLRTISAEGRRAFYEGPLARSIVEDIQSLGGQVTSNDLARYRARPSSTLTVAHGESVIATVDGLTAGPSLVRCLAGLGPAPAAAPDASTYESYAAALRSEYTERLATMGDSLALKTPACTSHLSVIDRDGNMVSLTQTLVSIFGSKVLLPRSGILMNNSIMTFDPRPGRPNSIGPGRRPLTNMCPVLATRHGRAHFALGAAGGRRILPAVMQLTDFMSRFGLHAEAAFDQPRIDSSGTDVVNVDPRLSKSIRDALALRFPTAEAPRMIYPLTYACPTAVWQGPDGVRQGVTEAMQPWADAVAE